MPDKPEFPTTPTPDEPGDMGEQPTPERGRPSRRSTGGRTTAKRDSPRASETPRTTSSPASGKGTGSARPTSGGSARDLKGRLEEFFAGMALIPMAAGDVYSAHIISSRSTHLAEAWADLAKQNPAVKRVLEGLLQGGAWGGVLLASGSIVVPILGHYGVLPAMDPWAGVYGDSPAPVQQGIRARPMPGPEPVDPSAFNIPGYERSPSPPNPRASGAGTPLVNSDGAGTMTPPVSPGEPAGVVTVSGSNSRANGNSPAANQ